MSRLIGFTRPPAGRVVGAPADDTVSETAFFKRKRIEIF